MGIQAITLAHKAGQNAFALGLMGATALYMIDAGRLHEAERLVKQGIQLGTTRQEILLASGGLARSLSSRNPAGVEPA